MFPYIHCILYQVPRFQEVYWHFDDGWLLPYTKCCPVSLNLTSHYTDVFFNTSEQLLPNNVVYMDRQVNSSQSLAIAKVCTKFDWCFQKVGCADNDYKNFVKSFSLVRASEDQGNYAVRSDLPEKAD